MLSDVEIMEPIGENINNKYVRTICNLLSEKIKTLDSTCEKMDVYMKKRQIVEKYETANELDFDLFQEIQNDSTLARYILDIKLHDDADTCNTDTDTRKQIYDVAKLSNSTYSKY